MFSFFFLYVYTSIGNHSCNIIEYTFNQITGNNIKNDYNWSYSLLKKISQLLVNEVMI